MVKTIFSSSCCNDAPWQHALFTCIRQYLEGSRQTDVTELAWTSILDIIFQDQDESIEIHVLASTDCTQQQKKG